MHAGRSTRGVNRRLARVQSSSAPAPHCVMHLTVDASAITTLRQLVMRFCGDAMEFMRVAVCSDTRKAKVWLCVSASMTGAVMDMILASLPAAEFGRVKNQTIV